MYQYSYEYKHASVTWRLLFTAGKKWVANSSDYIEKWCFVDEVGVYQTVLLCPFMPLVVSMEMNRRHYFQSNLRICVGTCKAVMLFFMTTDLSLFSVWQGWKTLLALQYTESFCSSETVLNTAGTLIELWKCHLFMCGQLWQRRELCQYVYRYPTDRTWAN